MKKLAMGIGLLAVAFAGGALAAKEAAKKEIVQETPDDLKWKEVVPGMPVMAAEIWKGPGGSGCSYIKFPKGTAVPLHWHSKDGHAVVISGSWGSAPEGGGPEKMIGPGAHQFIPAKLKHTTKCSEAADCIVYSCSPGPFDVKGLPPPPK